MKLVDGDDARFLPPVLVAILARGLRAPAARHWLARCLGRLAYATSREKRRRIEDVVAAALTASLAPREKRAIVEGAFRGVWEEMFRLVAGPLARSDFKGCEILGLEHLRSALARGRGAILWESNGLGARWMPKRLLREAGFALHQIHGSNNLGGFDTLDAEGSRFRLAFLRPFFYRCEEYFLDGWTILARDRSLAVLRDLERRLGRNEILCIAADGRGGERAIRLPFLGGRAIFATGMVSLARRSGAVLVPMFCVRRADGGFALTIEPMVAEGSGDREKQTGATLSRYAGLLEAYVRRYPEQYRNWHIVERDTGNFRPAGDGSL